MKYILANGKQQVQQPLVDHNSIIESQSFIYTDFGKFVIEIWQKKLCTNHNLLTLALQLEEIALITELDKKLIKLWTWINHILLQ